MRSQHVLIYTATATSSRDGISAGISQQSSRQLLMTSIDRAVNGEYNGGLANPHPRGTRTELLVVETGAKLLKLKSFKFINFDRGTKRAIFSRSGELLSNTKLTRL